jgi:hypothetical protein
LECRQSTPACLHVSGVRHPLATLGSELGLWRSGGIRGGTGFLRGTPLHGNGGFIRDSGGSSFEQS